MSHYWGWFAGLIGRKNPVATLCTLFLLSYSKLLRTTIVSLQFTQLVYPDGSSSLLWFYNPNILYFTLNRIPFFIAAITIILLGTVYTILLFFGQWLRKIRKIAKFTQDNRYNAFVDAYHALFHFKHRYWMGLLLFTRITHHLLSAMLDESTHLLIVCSLVCVLLSLKLLVRGLYKNCLVDFNTTTCKSTYFRLTD